LIHPAGRCGGLQNIKGIKLSLNPTQERINPIFQPIGRQNVAVPDEPPKAEPLKRPTAAAVTSARLVNKMSLLDG